MSHPKDFTPVGRNKLARLLLTTLIEQQGLKGLASPELVTRAIDEGRGLELVRHLTALKRDGGRA